MKREPFSLSKEFKMGVATSATQIEGGDTNNSWYEFSKNPENIKDGTCCVRADDHYNRVDEDISLMILMDNIPLLNRKYHHQNNNQ